jgi:hypothetical protein
MRPPPKDPYGRPGQQSGRGQRPGYGQQPAYGQQRPGAGQQPEEPKKQQPPQQQQQTQNIKADVVWALKNSGGGLSVFDIGSKITGAGKPRYGETKIQHVVEMLVNDGKVTKTEATGRVIYKWAVEAF